MENASISNAKIVQKIKVDSLYWIDEYSCYVKYWLESEDPIEVRPSEATVYFTQFLEFIKIRTGNENLAEAEYFYRNSESSICRDLSDYLNDKNEKCLPDLPKIAAFLSNASLIPAFSL